MTASRASNSGRCWSNWYPYPDPGRFKWFINIGLGTMAADMFRADGVESSDRYFGSGMAAMTLGTGSDIPPLRRFVVAPPLEYSRNLGGNSDHTHCVTRYPTATPVTDCNTISSQPHKYTVMQFGTRFGWR